MLKIQNKKEEDVEEVTEVTGEVDEVEGIQIAEDLEELTSSTEYSYCEKNFLFEIQFENESLLNLLLDKGKIPRKIYLH